jgi:regulator of protease activity HflC (stomatin/prohibitin superfamily)
MPRETDDDNLEYLPPERNKIFGNGSFSWTSVLSIIPVLLIALSAWVWFFCRIEPDSGEIAVLIRKTGKDLPSGQIIAIEKNQKGIQLEVLPEGRYFRNPYTWDWEIQKITDIPAGKLGIMIRQFGQDLPSGQIIADEGEKGIAAEILRPGKYRINPLAYQIYLFDAITIHPGRVGIVTNLVGKDVLFGDQPESKNTFLVKSGEKGVQSEALDPGTYYLNPFLVDVTELNLQSQRFDFSGKDAINFLSFDGFNITVEGTIEWAIKRESAAMITVRVGDLEDILNKIILPRARGFSRIEGSKKMASEYITGKTRQEFQDNLFKHLQETCEERGVKILSTLIRNIVPPQEIAGPIREKEIAVQDRKKYEQQIIEAQSAAELAKQEQLAIQNREKVEQETIKIKAVIEVKQIQSVALTDTQRNLEVAKIENQSADYRVQALKATGEAERDVIHLTNLANAEVLKNNVEAFGSGWNYAYYTFVKTLGPKLHFIFANEEGSFGKIFEEFSKERK